MMVDETVVKEFLERESEALVERLHLVHAHLGKVDDKGQSTGPTKWLEGVITRIHNLPGAFESFLEEGGDER